MQGRRHGPRSTSTTLRTQNSTFSYSHWPTCISNGSKTALSFFRFDLFMLTTLIPFLRLPFMSVFTNTLFLCSIVGMIESCRPCLGRMFRCI